VFSDFFVPASAVDRDRDPVCEAIAEQRGCWATAVDVRAYPSFHALQRKRVARDRVTVAAGGTRVQLIRGAAPAKLAASVAPRGEVQQFSRKSRHRLLTFVNSIDRRVVAAERVWFVTLTYPRRWPGNWQVWKDQLDAFVKRLQRRWGRLGVVWKLEPQKRGAPHFHLLVYVSPEMAWGMTQTGRAFRRGRMVTMWQGGQLSAFRKWASRAWFLTVGSGDRRHLKAGANTEPMCSWRQCVAYAGKYLGKDCVFCDAATGEVLPAGRFWGIRNREAWPIEEVTTDVGEEVFIKVRRTLRKYIERVERRPAGLSLKGRVPRSVSVFCPAEVVGRLVDHWAWWKRSSGPLDSWSRLYDLRESYAYAVNLSRERWFHS
jgi:hypothetical protein